MLPRDLYRTDPDAIRAMLEARHTDAELDRLLDVDRQWRDLVVRLEELRAQRNAGSKEVGALFRDGRTEEGEAKRAEMGVLGDEIKDLEERTGRLEGELQQLELTIPNIVDVSVPVGVDEELAAAVTRLCREPELRARLTENGSHRAHQIFGLEAMAHQYRELYHEMIRGSA